MIPLAERGIGIAADQEFERSKVAQGWRLPLAGNPV